jgi:DNA-binding transcriptional ArsR family regulator
MLSMDNVAQALADPIRRKILRMVRKAPLSAGAIAGAFSVSRPAVSRHLRVLRNAGLVRDEADGRERVYRLEATPLAPLEAFVIGLRMPYDERAEWEHRFMALETEVHRTRARTKSASRGAMSDQARKKSA